MPRASTISWEELDPHARVERGFPALDLLLLQVEPLGQGLLSQAGHDPRLDQRGGQIAQALNLKTIDASSRRSS